MYSPKPTSSVREDAPPSGIKAATAIRLIDKLLDRLITHKSWELRVGETPVDSVIRLLEAPNSTPVSGGQHTYASIHQEWNE